MNKKYNKLKMIYVDIIENHVKIPIVERRRKVTSIDAKRNKSKES